MTAKLGVATQALHAHGKGSQEVSDQLAGLLEQARVSDDCFGPIGEWMATIYFNALEECQRTTTKAGKFMDHMSQAVTKCAENYTATDEEQSANMAKIDIGAMRASGGGPGTLNDLNSAGGPPGGYWEQTAGYGSSWASTSQSLSDASSPPDIAIATVNARAEQLNTIMSPGQAFIDNGLGFLVSIAISPLVELILEPAIGDPEQMRSTGKGWEEVAQWVEKMGEHETDRAKATTPSLPRPILCGHGTITSTTTMTADLTGDHGRVSTEAGGNRGALQALPHTRDQLPTPVGIKDNKEEEKFARQGRAPYRMVDRDQPYRTCRMHCRGHHPEGEPRCNRLGGRHHRCSRSLPPRFSVDQFGGALKRRSKAVLHGSFLVGMLRTHRRVRNFFSSSRVRKFDVMERIHPTGLTENRPRERRSIPGRSPLAGRSRRDDKIRQTAAQAQTTGKGSHDLRSGTPGTGAGAGAGANP